MKMADIEKTYREVTQGFDEPEVIWILGKTLKEMARRLEKEVKADSDGRPIEDGAMYEVSERGTFRMQ